MRFQPTLRCAAAFAAVAPQFLVNPFVGLAFLFTVLGLTMTDYATARSKRPTAARHVPPFVVRGVPTPMRIESTGEVFQPGTDVLQFADGMLTAQRRGRHVLPPVIGRSQGRFKLANWVGPVTEAAELVVHPNVLAARRLSRMAQRNTFEEDAGRARGPLGLGTSFESLRDYLPDDDVRLINWKASARSGQPVVNQFRLEQARDVVILLDAGRLMTALTGPSPSPTVFDVAVDAATALAYTVDAIGDRCGLIAFADRPLARLAPRAGAGRSVAAAMAALEPAMVDSDFETAFRALPTKRAVAIVVTDLVDEAAAAALQHAVPVLSRRHQVMIVAPDDPNLAAMVAAGGEPTRSTRPALRAAAAASLLAERDVAAAVLKRAGAVVVSAPPDRLAQRACAGYLDLKSRARA